MAAMLSRAGLTVALRVSVGGAIAACLGVKLGQGLELLGSCVWTRLQRWRSLCEVRNPVPCR